MTCRSDGSLDALKELRFNRVETDVDIRSLARLAEEIWRECFTEMISAEQISYMLDKFQSEGALSRQIRDGYEYYIMKLGEESLGYFGVCIKVPSALYTAPCLFLSKLYLKKDSRRKGFARLMFSEVKRIAKERDCELIWLTVNKKNAHAISVYEHFGMRLLRGEVTDIGGGFVMDDYVYGCYC